jgi:hypothetical protein
MKEKMISRTVIVILTYMEREFVPHAPSSLDLSNSSFFSILHESLSVIDSASFLSVSVFLSMEIDVLVYHLTQCESE